MVEVLNRPPKPFAWSYTAVDNFHTCAKLYYHRNIRKDVSDDTTYRDEGGKIHEIMRDAVRGVHPLPHHLRRWQRWIDELHFDGIEPIAERRLAFTQNAKPCDYFDKRVDPWCRLNIDVLKFYPPNRAMVWDWKTGKIKTDTDQLMLYAIALFIHHRQLDTVDASLIFLKEDQGDHIPRRHCTYELRITLDDAHTWWKLYRHKIKALQHAVADGRPEAFAPRPSGLCRRHCPVTSCQHNGGHQ